MRTTRAYALCILVLFSCLVRPNATFYNIQRNLCYPSRGAPLLIADCIAAINMIPDGNVQYNGDDPPTFSLPHTARRPRRELPALFRARSCMIVVTNYRFPPRRVNSHHSQGPPGTRPGYPASAMFFRVWPAVKATATAVVEMCKLANGDYCNQGLANVDVAIDGHY